MKFHPKGFYSVNATLLTPGGVGAFPGQSEPYFLIEADPAHGVEAGFVVAADFLAEYEPGSHVGKSTPSNEAERAAVAALIAG